jgi:hypothetical protein
VYLQRRLISDQAGTELCQMRHHARVDSHTLRQAHRPREFKQAAILALAEGVEIDRRPAF